MQNQLLARQPIYTAKNEIYAFELLYRNSADNNASIKDNLSATAELLANLCTESLSDNLADNHPIFINVDLNFIVSNYFFTSPPMNVVFDILDVEKVTEQHLPIINCLVKNGFKFSINYHYALHKTSLSYVKLFRCIQYLRINLLEYTLPKVAKITAVLSIHSFKLLAEKVETPDNFNECKGLGFALFQGYYLQRPAIIEGKKISSAKQTALRLIAELSRPEISNDEIANLIATDTVMTFKLLKVVNCPLYPFKREIENVHEAVIMLGVDIIKQWAQILTLVSESNQPIEIFRILLIRAKTCELYANSIKLYEAKHYFTIGLLSGIDAVLQVELQTALDQINLNPLIKEELLGKKGQGVLSLVLSYEKQDEIITSSIDKPWVQELQRCYWQAITWTDELFNNLMR